MDQTTGADDFLNTTIIEGFADDVCPINQSLAEVTIFHTKIQSNTFKNLLFNRRGRIGLFKGYRKPFKECFVEHIGADKSTVVRTLTFGVCSGNHVESSGRFHETTNLFQEDTFTFKDRLKTQDFIRSKVNLIQKENCTTFQCFNHWTIMPGSFTIYQTKTANQVILISLNRNVNTNQFTTKLSARLLNTERFTITRKTRNKRWIKKTGLNNFFNIIKVTKLDKGIIFFRNECLFYRRNHSRSLKSTFDFFNFLLSNFKIPLSTTNFKWFKTLRYSLIRNIFRSTIPTNIGSNELSAKGVFKIVKDLIVGHLSARHNQVVCFN